MDKWCHTTLSFRFVLVCAVCIRLGLIAYGEWQDKNMVVKFTDVDYRVFTDAARHVLAGRSPYQRATYRYTPILAFAMVGNILVVDWFGKILFSACDLIVCWLVKRLVEMRGADGRTANLCSLAWLFNPLTMTVSVRGNAESLLATVVLLVLFCLYLRKETAAGVCLGVAVHLKLFPIMYTLPMYLFINEHYGAQPLVQKWLYRKGMWRFLAYFFNRGRICFALATVTTFLALSVWMYAWYGFEFIQETYLYHVTRRDNRHNFSVYFYALYLSWQSTSSAVLSLSAFLPQVILLFTTAIRLHTDIAACCFVQTFIFVTFNKVCTSQYFLWYLCLLPLQLAFSRLTIKKGTFLFMLWLSAQGLWLAFAYQLEFLGENTFTSLWLAGLVFFVVNVAILTVFLTNQMVFPVFTTGHFTCIPKVTEKKQT